MDITEAVADEDGGTNNADAPNAMTAEQEQLYICR
jgi:hypothetical protein